MGLEKRFIHLTLWLALLSVALCSPVVPQLKSRATVRHGDSYIFQSLLDESFLTATSHKFRPNYGVEVGRVISSEFHGTPNQIWDAIRWPDTPDNQFWVYPKGASLNEITANSDVTKGIPDKNLIEFITVQNPPNVEIGNSTEDEIQNYRRPSFLIKSVVLNACVENRGLDLQIVYKPCNPSRPGQNFLLELFYEDKTELGRSKTKFYCKFSSG